jgi:predicted DNA-binding transcriptional regulator AlpA
MQASKMNDPVELPKLMRGNELIVNAPPAKFCRVSKIIPRGLRRADAAGYLGISPSQFDKWVLLGRAPVAKKIGGVVLWDRFALDEAIEAIFYPVEDADLSKWDDVRP